MLCWSCHVSSDAALSLKGPLESTSPVDVQSALATGRNETPVGVRRYRHLMLDLGQLLPHAKKDFKLDTKSDRGVINEVHST